MSILPDGLSRRSFSSEKMLATRGTSVYGEPVEEGWRRWSPERSKVASMFERGFPVDLKPDSSVLYLGAASGTTVSHIADIVDVVYAVEFAPAPMRSLLAVAEDRRSIIPLLKDARLPETYAHVVEADIDLVIQDVATRDQAAVALANKQFLADDGTLLMAIKARSEDVTADPDTVFSRVKETLSSEYQVTDSIRLDPEHIDHMAIRAIRD